MLAAAAVDLAVGGNRARHSAHFQQDEQRQRDGQQTTERPHCGNPNISR
jgi:hypothetical protein